MRAIFGAFQRGLDRGRKGLPATEEAPGDATARSTGTAKPTQRQLPRGAGKAPAPAHIALTDADPDRWTSHAAEGTDTAHER